jgi:hypothetical protein
MYWNIFDKIEITKGALEAFTNENIKQINFYLSLSDTNMDLLLKKLSYLFYSNQIYFYEPDGSAIM